MQGILHKMHVQTYDTDHGYRKEMVRENMTCVFISCKLTRLDNVAMTDLVLVSRNTR